LATVSQVLADVIRISNSAGEALVKYLNNVSEKEDVLAFHIEATKFVHAHDVPLLCEGSLNNIISQRSDFKSLHPNLAPFFKQLALEP
jgi:hypothetical protein